MATKFINIKNDSKIWGMKKSKPPKVKSKDLSKAILCLKEARRFILFFKGSPRDIDFAISYLEKLTK